MCKIINKKAESKYKHVYASIHYDKLSYLASVHNGGRKRYSNEREAAIAADIMLINLGREPVNILTRKN